MARRIRYTGTVEDVLPLAEVEAWLRLRPNSKEIDLLKSVLLPGVIAQCEARTSAAIAPAEYQESWSSAMRSGQPLDLGQATRLISVVTSNGDVVDSTAWRVQQDQRETFVHYAPGLAVGGHVITYEAGIDLAAYPSVKTWLLMAVATLFAQRELIVVGTITAELPKSFVDFLLSDITVPPRF